jgi:predicted amidophosphoribosyltransferase
MALTESLQAQAIRELASNECAACGKFKNRNNSFCKTCFYTLSAVERNSLYTTFADGYAEIYDELKTKLRSEATR